MKLPPSDYARDKKHIQEDIEFLNQMDIERSYAGSRKPQVERNVHRPSLQEIQDKPWYDYDISIWDYDWDKEDYESND